jgi:hypothetical protein
MEVVQPITDARENFVDSVQNLHKIMKEYEEGEYFLHK